MTSHPINNGSTISSSSDDDDDFSPVLPALPQAPPSTQHAPPASTVEETPAPPLKRERHDDTGNQTTTPTQPAALATSAADVPLTAAALSSEVSIDTETDIEAWETYTSQRLPSAALYERSFQHTTLQDTYDALAATPDMPATEATAAATTIVAAPVHDLCVYDDALGALIATVDAAGVVRVWRKLPRGVFFLTELDKIFSPSRKPAGDGGSAECDALRDGHAHQEDSTRWERTYWAHAYTSLQLLVFVCVEEEKLSEGDAPHDVKAEMPLSTVPQPTRAVRVHLRQVNPVTLTVEQRHSFAFAAPVQPVATLSVAEVSSNASLPVRNSHSSANHVSSTLPYALAYTRRPTFLTHQYAPYIAFFVSLPAPSSGGGALGGNGVVLSPCFPSFQTAARQFTSGGFTESSVSSSVAPVQYTPTRLSVANPVVQCMQHIAGLERGGTAPCVLIDAAGIVDYCTIEVAPDASTGVKSMASASNTRTTGLTLKLIAGLAAVPPASPEARLWRQWICFDRRQRTGFFSLVRDAQQALKQQQQHDKLLSTPHDNTPSDVQVIPAALQRTPDNRYVVIWSIRVLRTALSCSAHSRIPSTQRRYRVMLESCLHVLEFSSGACVGAYSEALEDAVPEITSTEDIDVRLAEWVQLAQLRSRALATHLRVEEAAVTASTSPSAGRAYYVMMPAVSCVQLLCGGTGVFESFDLSNANGTQQKTVEGRQVHVYKLVIQQDAGSPASRAVPPKATMKVRRLLHSPGELEPLVSQSAYEAPEGKRASTDGSPLALAAHTLHLHFTSHEETLSSYNKRNNDGNNSNARRFSKSALWLDSERCPSLCRAPLLLLRRAVAPSQDLKNLVAAAPLGAALGTEARKQLFLAGSNGAAGDGAESLFLTTSAEAGMTALLVYSCDVPFTGVAMQRFVAKTALAARTRDGALRKEEEEANDAAEIDKDAEQKRRAEEHRLWLKLCADLHRERDYACGALLMTTVDPPPGTVDHTAVAAGPISASSKTAGEAPQDTPEAPETESSTVDPSTASAAAATPAAPRGRVVKPNTPEAYVVDLLKNVVPPLGEASTRLPVALVHIRGYGTVRVHLMPHVAPLATDNFIRLSRRHYYDRLTFHRVIPHVIVQGGCPRGDGTGGESAFEGGKAFKDEALHLFPFFSHTAEKQCCWLCMANAGPDTNGSQFFFTVPGGEAMPWLNGHHTVFGFAVEGLEVVRAVSLAARDAEDKPLSPIVIERVDILSG